MKIILIGFGICIILTTLFFFSCVSSQVREEVEKEQPEEKIIEEPEISVLEKGRELLALPTADLFFAACAHYSEAFSEDVGLLLQEYKEKQESLFIQAMESKNYEDTWFYFNNLLPFDNPGEQNKNGFYSFLIKGFLDSGYVSTSRYLSYLTGRSTPITESPFFSVTGFDDILVEIYMVRTYEDKYRIKRKEHSFGSGFLMNNTQIITAFHIIESCFGMDTESYTLAIKKGDTLITKVDLKGWDSLTDIALLEIEDGQVDVSTDFMSMIGNSNTLKQGDDIYCLGHHSGFTSTLTKGIVSATERHAPEVGTWIQIDANITPGASGGMAIGRDRKIYGMIVAGLIYEDINFIIPSNLILSVIDRLKKGEQIRRPWIGALLEQSRGDKGTVTVVDLFPTSPLHLYNIKKGYTLLEINNQPIKTIKEAQDILNNLFAGNLVHLKMYAFSDEVNCWIILERRPDYPIYNATRDYNKLSSLYPHFGFAVDGSKMLNQPIKRQEGIINLNFYPVTRIEKNSFLDDQGVRIGDYLGFLSDDFKNKTRYIEILHFPKDLDPEKFDDFDVYDFIYQLEKRAYDQNIL